MKYSYEKIKEMASPIGKTEETKCKNAIRMVRDALKNLNYTDDGKDISNYETDFNQ